MPHEFVQSIREDVYHDLGASFHVVCFGVRYVDEDLEEQDGEADSQPETHTPKTKPKTAPAPSPSGTHCAQATRFLLRHSGPYWQRYECFCESFFTIPWWKRTFTELCHCQGCCCSQCQAFC